MLIMVVKFDWVDKGEVVFCKVVVKIEVCFMVILEQEVKYEIFKVI